MATWHSHKSCCQLLIKNKALQTGRVCISLYVCACVCVWGRGGSEVGWVGRSRRPETLHSDLCANWPLAKEPLGKENGDGRRKTSCVSREWKQPFDCLIKTAHCDSHCLSSSPNLNCCPPPPPRPHLISLISPSASRSLSLQSLPNTSCPSKA